MSSSTIPEGARGADVVAEADSIPRFQPGLKQGDSTAAAEVFRRFAHRLLGLARTRLDAQVRRQIDPEDVAQSVFKTFSACRLPRDTSWKAGTACGACWW